MRSPQVINKVITSRGLPVASQDGTENERDVRGGRYGDFKVESAWNTDHLLADEGAMMVASLLPGATQLFMGIDASFVNTIAFLVLSNSDAPGGKRLYPKSLRLALSSVGTSGVDLRYAIVLDDKDRTPSTISNGSGGSGVGTPASATMYKAPAFCTNMDVKVTPVGVPYFMSGVTGAGVGGTVPSPGQNARTIVGNGYLKNSIVVAKDQYTLQFGGTDRGGSFQSAAALGNYISHAPAVVIGPGQHMVIYLWSTSNVTASNAFDDEELTWIEK